MPISPPQPPLSHHEIIAVAAPFSRSGRHPDLASSDRAERRLAFKPRPCTAPGVPPLTETLELHNPSEGQWRLTRTLAAADGVAATLVAEGADPAELLQAVGGVAPEQQWRADPTHIRVLSHRLQPVAKAPGRREAVLTHAVVPLDGLRLKLRVPQVSGIPADLELAADGLLPLPEDLLAVLGWDWSRLELTKGVWTGTLLLRGSGAARGDDAAAKLQRTAEHLVRTLAEPPAAFHRRLRLRRWGVALRRAVPLLVVLGLIIGAAAVPQLDLPPDSMLRMVIFNAPPLLLLLFFGLREMPRIEIPPLPRALQAPGWRSATGPNAEAEAPSR